MVHVSQVEENYVGSWRNDERGVSVSKGEWSGVDEAVAAAYVENGANAVTADPQGAGFEGACYDELFGFGSEDEVWR